MTSPMFSDNHQPVSESTSVLNSTDSSSNFSKSENSICFGSQLNTHSDTLNLHNSLSPLNVTQSSSNIGNIEKSTNTHSGNLDYGGPSSIPNEPVEDNKSEDSDATVIFDFDDVSVDDVIEESDERLVKVDLFFEAHL